MSSLKVTIEEIKDLMDKMAQTGLGNLEIDDGDFKLSLSAKEENIIYSTNSPVEVKSTNNMTAPTVVTEVNTVVEKIAGNEVKAPIVGTFYSAPSPEKPNFVKVGDKVKKGDVLFIIESMKLMNEVQSEFDGEVVDICIENGSPVEFDQTIMIIR